MPAASSETDRHQIDPHADDEDDGLVVEGCGAAAVDDVWHGLLPVLLKFRKTRCERCPTFTDRSERCQHRTCHDPVVHNDPSRTTTATSATRSSRRRRTSPKSAAPTPWCSARPPGAPRRLTERRVPPLPESGRRCWPRSPRACVKRWPTGCSARWRRPARAAGDSRVDPDVAAARFRACGRAYIGFALDEPGLFAVAFHPCRPGAATCATTRRPTRSSGAVAGRR